MLKRISFIIIMILLLVGLCGNVLAKDKYTATSTINGVTANWEYELNDSNQIENLKCTNASELTGNVTIPSTLDEKTVSQKDIEFHMNDLPVLPRGIDKVEDGYVYFDDYMFADGSNDKTLKCSLINYTCEEE